MNDLGRIMPVETGSNELEIVDFRILVDNGKRRREELFGINVSKVTELLYLPDRIVAVPQPHPAQLGMVSIRGTTLPVFDMGKFLNIPGAVPIVPGEKHTVDDGKKRNELLTCRSRNELPTLVVTEFSRLSMGFVVHRVALIRRIAWTDVKPVEALLSGGEGSRRVVGTVLVKDDLVKDGNAEESILQLVDLEAVATEAGFFDRQNHDIDIETQLPPKGKTILVVDDSPTVRKTIAKLLEKHGYAVVQETDGARAWQRLQTPGIDLVLSDVEMPEMDGYTLTTKIRESERLKHLPVVLNSSMSGRSNHKKGEQVGANAYIVKMDSKEIVEKVERFLPVSQ